MQLQRKYLREPNRGQRRPRKKKKKKALIPPVQKGNIENCIFCLFTLRKNPRR